MNKYHIQECSVECGLSHQYTGLRIAVAESNCSLDRDNTHMMLSVS